MVNLGKLRTPPLHHPHRLPSKDTFVPWHVPHIRHAPPASSLAAEYLKQNSNYKKDETWLAIGESFLAFCVLWLTWIHLTFFLNRFQVPVAGMVRPLPFPSLLAPLCRSFPLRYPRMAFGFSPSTLSRVAVVVSADWADRLLAPPRLHPTNSSGSSCTCFQPWGSASRCSVPRMPPSASSIPAFSLRWRATAVRAAPSLLHRFLPDVGICSPVTTPRKTLALQPVRPALSGLLMLAYHKIWRDIPQARSHIHWYSIGVGSAWCLYFIGIFVDDVGVRPRTRREIRGRARLLVCSTHDGAHHPPRFCRLTPAWRCSPSR